MSRPPFRASEPVDFLIVGSGAAGGVLANELATAGFSVVVLEQGPWLREKDFTHDEFDVGFRSALTNDPARQPNTYRRSSSDAVQVRKVVEYGRLVGGGSVHFTANYWRFHETDFRERSRWGDVPGATLADWPISYAELEPYYTKAEYEIGVSGLDGSNPFEPPRSRPYPLPPMRVKSSGVLFERAARRLGLHPYPAPVAILSRPYRGRGACTLCGFCEKFGCEVRAKSSTLATVIPAALKTGRCEIRPNSYARKIQVDRRGRAGGVVYFDARRREVFQRAKAVVVCANGAETPRLLLMSKSNLFPDGLANSSGLVGKNFMVDSWVFVSGLFEHPLNEFKGIQVTRVVQDYYDSDPRRGCYGGAGIDCRFDWYPISFALSGLPPDAPAWGSGFKEAIAHYYTRTMALLAHCTCLPVESNSVSLDPAHKDAWGLPALRVTFDSHPDDVINMRFMKDRMVEMLDVAGARKTWALPIGDLLPSAHLMGTCRMGDDAKRSVINRDHRAHDVPNLFLVDGSSLVTSGRQQPTATIQALAYRAAERITRLAKSGSL